MKVLIIDDQQQKAEKIAKLLASFGIPIDVCYANNAHDGFFALQAGHFNLVLLDVVLPMSFGEEATEQGSLWFVREAHRKLQGPGIPLIVGTTQYAESLSKVEDAFGDFLWSVIHITDSNDKWPRQLKQALNFSHSNAQRINLSGTANGEQIDVAIVTALRSPEYSELISVLEGGQQMRIDETNEVWLKCDLSLSDGRHKTLITACADDMGVAAMASLVTRVTIACRPKTIILVGIMAGNSQRVGFSDLIIVEDTWDCRAGKITETGFSPDMKSRECDYTLANRFMHVIDADFLLNFWSKWRGPRPDRIPSLHKGSVACSSAVIANGTVFAELEEHKRKILGLEMEGYGCYDAVRRLGTLAPKVICVKSVCDFGDAKKNDVFQPYCAALAASAAITVAKDVRFYDV